MQSVILFLENPTRPASTLASPSTLPNAGGWIRSASRQRTGFDAEAYLAEAQRLSHTGSWAIDPVTGKIIYYSEEMFRIMGLEPTLDPPDMETVFQRFHPEDLPPIIEGIERTLAASKKRWSVMDQTAGSPESEALVKELEGPMGRAAAALEFRV